MASCPSSVPQIDRDLEIFQNQIPLDISKHFSYLSAQYHPQSASFCHYVIKNNLLHRKCFGEHVGFAMFMDSILLFLLRRAVFPDVNFIANLGDYPLSGNRKNPVGIAPVFSWCGQKDKFDIVMPTYDLTESSLTAMDRSEFSQLLPSTFVACSNIIYNFFLMVCLVGTLFNRLIDRLIDWLIDYVLNFFQSFIGYAIRASE